MRRILMPRMDIDMEKGSVVEWMKQEGEPVAEEKPVVKIMSEKVTYEVPSPASGTLHRIITSAGKEVPIGQIIGILMEQGDTEEALEAAVNEALFQPAEPEREEAEKERRVVLSVPRREPARVVASPVARRLAEEHGIDLRGIVGTGPDERITKEDVLRLVEEASQFSETIPLTGVRKTVAERMSQSFRTAPHATVTVDIDMSHAADLRKRLQEKGIGVSYNALLIKATAKALREFPILNATLKGEEIKVWKAVNICVAVDTPNGLVAPVVKNADQRSLVELTKAIEELASKARENRLTTEDMKGGTFTITNLGMLGVDQFQPIINPPQAAILAVGRISQRPVAEGEAIIVKPMAALSLAFDHRIVDGAPAARFLGRLREILQTLEEE
jgi:pyruvate dehydrogenase E2 component (dihydrolipoamide acetyltransferase)